MASGDKLLRVVVDTNVAVSSLLNPRGNPNRLFRAWQRGEVLLVTSTALVAEVERVLHRSRIQRKYALTDERIQEFVASLQAGTVQADSLAPLPLACRDPNDDMFLAVALGGAADYLVTGDADLLALAGAPELGDLQIVTVRAFLDALGGSSDRSPNAAAE